MADNLGALSFLIDMLAVQPQLAKSLFRFDPQTGMLTAVMGQTERVSAFAAFDEATLPAVLPLQAPAQASLLDQLRSLAMLAADTAVADEHIAQQLEPLAAQAFAADRGDLARLLGSAQRVLRSADADAEERQQVRAGLADAAAALAPPPAPELPSPTPIPPPASTAPPAGGSGLEDDAEMREIFIEEAREVIADAGAALERLADAPDDATDMTAVRRAFHTLKGSSRMLGLREFGEAGWACEQLYNARLAHSPRMDHALRQLSGEALAYLGDWTEAIAAGQDRGHRSADVAKAADALREDGLRLTIVLPQPPAGPAPVRILAAPPLPAVVAPDFELDIEEPSAQAQAQAQVQVQVQVQALAGEPGLEVFPDIEATTPLPRGAELEFEAVAAADMSGVLDFALHRQ